MAIDYQKTAKELVKELGGNDNISNVTHCATRLRFILKRRIYRKQRKGGKDTGRDYYRTGRWTVSGSYRKSR